MSQQRLVHLQYGAMTHVTPSCRFEEQDVAMMSVALRAAGLQLRAADPAAMRDFLVAVNARAAEAAAQGAMTPRAEVSPAEAAATRHFCRLVMLHGSQPSTAVSLHESCGDCR